MLKNSKKVAKLLLVTFLLSLVVPSSLFAADNAAASDIQGHWAEETINEWMAEGLIGGYQDGTFQPDKAITRAEFIKLVNKAVDAQTIGAVDFNDVSSADWFYGELQLAIGAGYVAGFEDGTFRPSETVTRAQAAAFIAKADNLPPNEQAANVFTDSYAITDWAKGAVGAAAQAGFMGGYTDGAFGPERSLTRAEAVVMLDRVMTSIQEAALTVTESGTVISNKTITGDVTIAASVGEGTVTLDNVTITGDLIVKGGGSHSVYLKNSEIKGKIVVAKKDVRVVFQGDTTVGEVIINVPATLDAQSFKGKLSEVTVTTAVASGQTVTIKVPVQVLNLEGKATVNIQSAVDTVNANAAVKITGNGKIDTLNANASGITTQIKAGTVHTASGVTAPVLVTTGGGGGGSSSGGSSDGDSTIAVSGITVTPTDAKVAVGKTVTLTAAVTPTNATDKTVTWASSDETIATVANGIVTGVAEGTATITAKAGNKTAACTIVVTNMPTITVGTLPEVAASTLVTAQSGAISSFDPDGVPSVNVALTKGSKDYSNVRLVVNVTSGNANNIQLIAKDTSGNWYDIVKTGWGPMEGFSIADATTQVYIVSDAAGNYEGTIQLIDVTNNSAVVSESVAITVNSAQTAEE